MKLRSLSTASLLALAALPIVGFAQETTGKEDERMEALARNAAAEQQQQWFGPRNKVSVAFRLLNSGGNVDFNNLGTVAAREMPDVTQVNVDRVYDSGEIQKDALRADEVDANGNQTSTPGGRYNTYAVSDDGSRVLYGDFRSYTPGQTRRWVDYSQDRLASQPGYIGMTNYSTTSDGASLSDKAGPSGGVELQLARDLGRVSRRIEWGFTTGIAINSINSKRVGAVSSTLNAHTDYYAVIGGETLVAIPDTILSGPSYNVFRDENGQIINDQGLETSAAISQTANAALAEDRKTVGGATVNGRWQVKGAYMLVKLGPSFRTQFNDYIELSGSVGFAGAFAGTEYSATESFRVENVGIDDDRTFGQSDTPLSSMATKFLHGYYADLTLAWTANETTGLFGGITAQQLNSYSQSLGDRLAKVDLGSAVGVRGGISIKF